MAQEIITIPVALMVMTGCNWTIDWRGQSSGVANDGSAQVIYNRFPRWVGQPTVALHAEQIDAWNAIRARVQGRAGLYRVPMIARTWPKGWPSGIPFSNGATFSTGMGFAYMPFAICPEGAAAGTREIVVETPAETISAGQLLSHADWPFIVTSVTPEGGTLRLGIDMPLRRAIPAGAEVQLRAHGLFQALDDTMGTPDYGGSDFTMLQLSFVEWLNRE